jgi:hypothetical protein
VTLCLRGEKGFPSGGLRPVEASAIADVLIEKGLLTKAELDAKMSHGQKLRDSLMRKLNEEVLKQS